MFGYIAINKAEMKFKDYDVYQAYYCGLCRRLKECYGKRGQLTLSYDMTFLIVLLTGLYEPKTIAGETRCIAHPLEKHPTKINEYTDYAASMNLILSYYKCKDDWTDERKRKGYIAAKALEPKIKKIESNYPEKVRLIHSKLEEINQYEKKGETNLDIGNNSYNPLKEAFLQKTPEHFVTECRTLLTMMMAECSREFEQLPILLHADILRNILYSGVWCRYTMVTSKRYENQNKENNHE